MNKDDFIKRLELEIRKVAQQRKEEERIKREAAIKAIKEVLPEVEINQAVVGDIEATELAIADLYAQDWISHQGELYHWTGKHYEKSWSGDEIKRIMDWTRGYVVYDKTGKPRKPYAHYPKVMQLHKWICQYLTINPNRINPSGLNCTNGVLEINWVESNPSWQLIPHDPKKHFYLYEPLATYDPEADPTYCDKLLTALSPQQQEVFLRTIAASLDLPTVRKYKGRSVRALLLKGDGSNGKDSLREVVASLFGNQGITGATLSDFVAYDNGRKFPLARLAKSKVNWSSENVTFTKLDNIQSLKAFITGDPLSMERKGQDEMEYTPQAIALFNCNDAPRITGTMEAIASRYGVLTFDKVFKHNADERKGEIEADPRFKYDPMFVKEQVVPAFLNRVLEALVDLMKEGIDYSSTVRALTDIQIQNSHLFQFAQEIGLTYVPDSVVSAGTLWEQLKEWYEENSYLTYEETNSGKKKAIWTEASSADKTVKGANQIISRFQSLFPKAKRVSVGKGNMALQGIGIVKAISFTGDANCLNGSQLTGSQKPLPDNSSEPITPTVEPALIPDPICVDDPPKLVETDIPKIKVELDETALPEETATVTGTPEALSNDQITDIAKMLSSCTEKEVLADLLAGNYFSVEHLEKAIATLPTEKASQINSWRAEINQTANQPDEIKIDELITQETDPDNRLGQWVRYQGKAYIVASLSGEMLFLREAGNENIVYTVHLSQVEEIDLP